ETVTGLGDGHHQGGGGRGQVEVAADEVQQWLGEVVAGDREAGGDGHEEEGAAAQPGGGARRVLGDLGGEAVRLPGLRCLPYRCACHARAPPRAPAATVAAGSPSLDPDPL